MGNALDKIKNLASGEKSSWLDEAKERRQNEAWRQYSFQIASRILIEIRKQKVVNGMTQKLLAEKMGVAPQYINKVLKGRENLTLETISKFEEVLNVPLIKVIKPDISGESESFSRTDEMTFVYPQSADCKSQIQKISRQKPEEEVQVKIDKALEKLIEFRRHVSGLDKKALFKYIHDLLNELIKNEGQKFTQAYEFEDFLLFASEPNKTDWKNYRIMNYSENNKYKNEG